MDSDEVVARRLVRNRRGVVLDAVAIDDRPDEYASVHGGLKPACLPRLSSKNGRPRLDGFPTKEIIGAGPGVDFGLAHPAFEFSGMLVGMLLPCCGVIHPATWAGKFFGGPDAVRHPAIMRQRPRGSSNARAGG
jgi:hypothetical protein